MEGIFPWLEWYSDETNRTVYRKHKITNPSNKCLRRRRRNRQKSKFRRSVSAENSISVAEQQPSPHSNRPCDRIPGGFSDKKVRKFGVKANSCRHL
jgi:hypothetical protein